MSQNIEGWRKADTKNVARWYGTGQNIGHSVIVGEMRYKDEDSYLVTLDSPHNTKTIGEAKTKAIAVKKAKAYMRAHQG